MLKEFKPSIGSTLLDVCLNVYTSVNLMPKLISDNNIQNYNLVTGVGDTFIYDTDFIYDEFMFKEIKDNNYKFTTGNINIPNANVTSENYLLAESGNILLTEREVKILV